MAIELKLLNKQALEAFIASADFQRLPSIPITTHRALSHIHNPRAHESDVLLILAYEGSEMTGYLGLLPDMISVSNNQYKCCSLSCFWVDPAHRGKGIGVKLLIQAHGLYDKIISSDYVPSSFEVYKRSGLFAEPIKVDGVRLYLRFDLHTILPPKRPLFKKIKPLLQLVDGILNLVFDSRLLFYKRRASNLRIEYVKEADDEIDAFIANHQQQELFKRKAREFNWILQYPWIKQKHKYDLESDRYFFTSTEEIFETTCIKVRGGNNLLLAFLMLTRRNGVVRMPYCYSGKESLDIVRDVISDHLVKWRATTFITYHPDIYPCFLGRGTPHIYRKKTQKPILLSKELHTLLGDMPYLMQDGDADAAFT